MLVHVDDDSLSCPSAEVRYELEDGQTTVIRIDTIGGMIGVTAQRHGWESVGDVTVDGEPGGWGFLETTLNPRNGSDPPGFVLGEAMTNGIVRPTSEAAADDRALYLRQLRATVSNTFLPELTSPTAIDAAGLVDRILAECIVEEEWAESLSTQYGAEFEALLQSAPDDGSAPVSPERPISADRFDDLRRQAAATVSRFADSDGPRSRSCACSSSMWSADSWSGSTKSGRSCSASGSTANPPHPHQRARSRQNNSVRICAPSFRTRPIWP